LEVLNELLEYEGCDVDYVNYIEGATPLHLAVKIPDPEAELRALIVDSLLDAGADPQLGLILILTWSAGAHNSRSLSSAASKIRQVKCHWTTYAKQIQKQGWHSAAIRLYEPSRKLTSLMVRIFWSPWNIL
jgi:Ankyrin repeat